MLTGRTTYETHTEVSRRRHGIVPCRGDRAPCRGVRGPHQVRRPWRRALCGVLYGRRTGQIPPRYGAVPFLRLAAGQSGVRGDCEPRSALWHGLLGPGHDRGRQPFWLADLDEAERRG